MSVIIFLAVLSILVIVHEWGHYITAKLLGVKVEKFSMGFGKKLFSRMHNGTEFMVCAIPLGGYVKMAGDERASCAGNKEEFFSHPVRDRALIVLMGPIINFLFAYICFYLVCIAGYPTLLPKVGKIMAGYPAQVAGFQIEDRVVQIDEKPITSWEDLQQYVAHSSGPLKFLILRNGEKMAVGVIPQERVVKNLFGKEEKVRLIGVSPKDEVTLMRYGIGESFGKAAELLIKNITLTLQGLYYVVTGVMPAKEALGGPIRIFGFIRDAATMGFSYLVFVMAIISLNLAIFNLFPIPVLDGGHLFFFAIEGIRKKPISLKVEDLLTKVGLSLLMCLMIFVLYNDVMEVGWIDSIKKAVHKIK